MELSSTLSISVRQGYSWWINLSNSLFEKMFANRGRNGMFENGNSGCSSESV